LKRSSKTVPQVGLDKPKKCRKPAGRSQESFMSFNTKLINLLKTDHNLVDDDGELLIAAVQDRAWKLDRDLIKLLLSDKDIKAKFFDEIENHWIFNVNTFIDYISQKNFLDNSYTRFKNRVGLTVDGKYLRERGEVALVWPYKDCILEGGQTKEEEKRKEIFFNEVLAQDEINRLLDPKVLTNFTRYTARPVIARSEATKQSPRNQKTASPSARSDIEIVKENVKDFKRDENGVIRENLILKGNNLLALHTLKTQFRGQVKLIYIDPPYNTGGDSFGYNDNFNHSTWLTFMKNRLENAKDFLDKSGVIYISIDENEIGYIQILMDEIFGKENRSGIITVKRGSLTGHKAINEGVVNLTEYLISYCKDKTLWKPKRLYKKRDRNERYNNFVLNRQEPISKWKFCSLLGAFSEYKDIPKTQLKKNLGSDFEFEIFEFIKANADSVIQFAYPDFDKVSKDVQKVIGQSQSNPDKVFHIKRENEPDIYLLNGQRLLFYSERLIEIDGELVTAEPLSDLWDDVLPNDLHNEGGVKLKKGKKPEKLISRIIELNTDTGDLFMDFHIGSGTSVSVAHKMGRQYIGIEQLDYSENDSLIRLQNVIAGEKSGITKSVNWQGGGDFIYCELMKYNEAFMEGIQAAKSSKELLRIWQEMAEGSFLNWYVNPEMPEEAVKDFEALSTQENGFEKQKHLLANLLDKNQLYVNYSEMDDALFKVSKEDKELNRKFYGE